MAKIIVVGGGEHAAVVADVLMASGHHVCGFVDDAELPLACQSMKLPRLGNIESVRSMSTSIPLIMGIGCNVTRLKIARWFEQLGFRFETAIHPSATLSQSAIVGSGTVVMPRVVINTNAVVGCHCIVNSAAVIEHDSDIGDGAHVSVGTVLAGRVSIGKLSLVGAGAVVLPHLTIGSGVSVGAGSVVTKSIPDDCVAMGVPARIRS